MTQQIRTSTTGELSASIEGCGEFNARSVEFMGSTDEPDFLLRGMDASRGLIFYFPRFESGHYVLGAGSANKAFYEVGGTLYGEVKEGFVDVTVEAEDEVSVSFSFSTEDKAEAPLIRITGSGSFKGRVPWTDNGRVFSNIVYGVDDPHILWDAPRFYTPKPGVVKSKIYMQVIADGKRPTEWEYRIMVGSNIVASKKVAAPPEYNYHLGEWLDLTNLVVPGTGFYIMADYYVWPVWSRWAYSGDLVFGFDPPDILHPANGSTITPKTEIHGAGVSGATVRLFESGSGAVEYGRGVVDIHGGWKVTPAIGFPIKYFPLIAIQNIGGGSSGWSKSVNYNVVRESAPSITSPRSGETVNSKPPVGGRGKPGATVYLHQAGDPYTVYGQVKIREDGSFELLYMAKELPQGPFTMTANQRVGDEEYSDWATSVSFIVKN